MEEINKSNAENKEKILTRLKRIEGQVKGIQRMVEEDNQCVDVLTQISAVRAAINKVGGIVLEKHSKTCLRDALTTEDKEKAVESLNKTIQSFLKFVD